jgi:hypothetical protein
MPFSNTVLGGASTLIRKAIESPNFSIPNQTGWAINKDGTAYFFNVTVNGNVIIASGGSLFFYGGPPANGNLLGSWSNTANTDAYGNAYPAGLSVGLASGQQIMLIPQVNSQFNITQAISGIIQAAAEFDTTDVNQVIPGLLGALLLGTGTGEKMATVMTSPIAASPATGIAVILASQNDAGTDTAMISIGTITTPDNSTEVFSPIITITPYAFIMYGGISGITTVTKTSGSGNISIPAGMSTIAKGEVWGPSGNGGPGTTLVSGGGAGSGEYAADTAFAIPSPGNVAYVVASPGSSSTMTGTSVTITGHSGGNGLNNTTGGAGGTGSVNAIHFDGAAGGSGQVSGSAIGGGGASSAGTNTHGNAGGSGATGGIGGLAVTGGGAGGNGGIVMGGGHTGAVGHAPGGGPGGSSTNATTGTAGTKGQVRLTYSPTAAPVILCSIANVSGTDQYGSAYPVGFAIQNAIIANVIEVNTLEVFTGIVLMIGGSPETWHPVPTLQNGWTDRNSVQPTYPVSSYRLTAEGKLEMALYLIAGTIANNTLLFTLASPYIPAHTHIVPVEIDKSGAGVDATTGTPCIIIRGALEATLGQVTIVNFNSLATRLQNGAITVSISL